MAGALGLFGGACEAARISPRRVSVSPFAASGRGAYPAAHAAGDRRGIVLGGEPDMSTRTASRLELLAAWHASALTWCERTTMIGHNSRRYGRGWNIAGRFLRLRSRICCGRVRPAGRAGARAVADGSSGRSRRHWKMITCAAAACPGHGRARAGARRFRGAVGGGCRRGTGSRSDTGARTAGRAPVRTAPSGRGGSGAARGQAQASSRSAESSACLARSLRRPPISRRRSAAPPRASAEAAALAPPPIRSPRRTCR